jgi:hypothetical protein
MSIKMKILMMILLALSFDVTWASSKKINKEISYPDYTKFVNDREHGKIEVRCEEIENELGNIICTFDQVVIQYQDIKPIEDSLNEVKSKTDDEIKNEYSKSCKDFDKDRDIEKIMADQLAKSTDERKKKFILNIKNICAYPSKDNVIRFIEDELSMARETCKIFNNNFTQKFRYNPSTRKWIHQEGPRSNCGIINIAYLERDRRKGYSDWAWNYTTRNIITNKSGQFLLNKCSELANGKDSIENEKTYFSAFAGQVEPTQMMNCKYINFAG